MRAATRFFSSVGALLIGACAGDDAQSDGPAEGGTAADTASDSAGDPDDGTGPTPDDGPQPDDDADATDTSPGSTDAAGDSTDDSGGSSDTGDGPPFEGCEGDAEAHAVLNAMWEEFDAEYAVFDVRLPDRSWDSVGHEACAALAADTSEDALFDVLIGMAETLDDGHVQLDAPSIDRYDDGWVSEYPHYDELYTLELNVEDNYLDGDLTWAADDWFAWGSIGSIGYISITSFDGLSPSGDEDDDIAAANAAMTMAIGDLEGSTGLIIDVRANEGGWDYVGLDVARWVAGEATLAWSEAYRDGPEHDDFSAWEDVEVEGAVANAFAGPVVVLTSGGTFSAAETFVLAMRVRDDVTVLGEPTSGHFSDLFDLDLPNGWSVTYSGERYRAADGMIYEAQGAPVDMAVELDVAALDGGTDVMLEAAITQLGG